MGLLIIDKRKGIRLFSAALFEVKNDENVFDKTVRNREKLDSC